MAGIGKLNKNLQSKTHNLPTSKSAFSLIELLVTLAIAVILSAVGVVSLTSYRSGQNLKLTLSETLQTVQATQKRAITQENGAKWGVHFVNSVSGGSTYSVFSGASYATGTIDVTRTLGRSITFSNPSTSGTIDVVFGGFTGLPSQNQIISLIGGMKTLVGDIVVNTYGVVNSRSETGLEGYWHFDENTSSTAYDASGMGNNGTLVNGPTWQAGTNCKAGSCLSFDGTNRYVDLGNLNYISTGGEYTTSVWIKFNQIQQTFFFGDEQSHNGGVMMQIDSSGYIQTYYGSYYTSTYQVSAGQWYNIVFVQNSGGINLFVNGNYIQNLTTNKQNDTSNNTEIGRFPLNSRYLNGLVDEVRVYNRALSATEILNQYNDLK